MQESGSEVNLTPEPPAGSQAEESGGGSGLLAILAWVVIVALTAMFFYQANTPGTPAPGTTVAAESAVSAQTQMMGRAVVALSRCLSGDWSERLLGDIAAIQNRSTVDRLAYIVIVAELDGPEEAIKKLDEVESESAVGQGATQPVATRPAVSESDRQLVGVLKRVFEAHSARKAVAITPDERQLLETKLEWFGEMALVSKGTKDEAGREAMLRSLVRFMWAIAFAIGWYVICGLTGVILLIVMLVLGLMRKLQHGFAVNSGRGGIYAETFAVWMLLFAGLRGLVQMAVKGGSMAIAFNIAAAVLAMFALCWPCIRGIPWSTVRRDIGLVLPRGGLRELVPGAMTYCMAIVIMFIGLLITEALMLLQKAINPDAVEPSHPALQALGGADWATIAQIMFLGVVVAPIGEEIMFRGVLYRNLRDVSSGWGLTLSMLFSALVSSFIFAAIHPQGWVLIPVLGGLAVGFCMAREWRGSLVPSMIAHAITNGVTLSLNVVLFSGG